MPIKLNSFVLPDEVTRKMKDDLRTTSQTKIEHGFALCAKPNSNIIIDRSHCKGNECRILVERKCDPEEMSLGTYHTHPEDLARMTATDMLGSCIEDISCVGGTFNLNQIKCFVRKKVEPDWKDKGRQLICQFQAKEYEKIEKPLNEHWLNLKAESKKLIEERNKAIEELEFSQDLNKRIEEYNKKFEEIRKDALAYEQKLKIFTDEYFNTINIF